MINRLWLVAFLFPILSSVAPRAEAQEYVNGWNEYRMCQSTAACAIWRETKQQACADWAASSTGYGSPQAGPDMCTITYAATGGTDTRAYYVTQRCPAGYGLYQLTQPYCRWAGSGPAPADPTICKAGEKSTVRLPVSAPFPTAYKGCEVTTEEVVACWGPPGASKPAEVCDYVVAKTGNPAPAGASSPPDGGGSAPPNTDRQPSPPFTGKPGGGCPKGTVQAGVGPDGIPMCVGTGTAPDNGSAAPAKSTSSTSATNPDGSTTTTTTTVQTNVDGSKTTTVDKVTTAPDGSKTVQQEKATGTTPTGTAGKETAPTEQTNFCKQNPTLSICRESSVAGKCGEITCLGDAIQCSTLRAAAAMQCKQAEDEAALKASPQKALGDSILSGSDPAKGQIDELLKGTTIDMSKANLDQSGFLGAGSCLAPKQFNFFGQAITMDFAEACENAQPARYVILALSFLAAYLIVSKSVLS